MLTTQKAIIKKSNIYDSLKLTEDVAAVITAMTDDEKPFIERCISSVFKNDHLAEVIICVEKNNTWIEQELIHFSDNPRLKIHKIPKCNAAIARNYGVSVSKSSWIAFCDGDDVWFEDKIAQQRTFALDKNMDVVGGDHLLTDAQGIVRAHALCLTMPMTSSWFVKKEVMIKYPFNESFKNFIDLNCTEDSEWWMRMGNKIKKGRCPNSMLYYRVRDTSLSSGSPSKERKALVIRLARIPILNKVIMLTTYLCWVVLRRKEYNI